MTQEPDMKGKSTSFPQNITVPADDFSAAADCILACQSGGATFQSVLHIPNPFFPTVGSVMQPPPSP